jgi:AraC-like DNA-binding protein
MWVNRTNNVSHRVPPPGHLLRIGAAAFIPELLVEQGLSVDATFARAGFSKGTYEQRRSVVPLRRLGLLFKSAAATSAQAEFGLMVGLRAGSRFPSWCSLPAQENYTVITELMRIISEPHIFPNSLLTLHVAGSISTVCCVTLPADLAARDHVTECAIGCAAGMLRALCGPRWRPRSFNFAHGPPPDPSRHVALLQAPTSFNAPFTGMEFEIASLDDDHIGSQRFRSGYFGTEGRQPDIVNKVRTVLMSWTGVGSPSANAICSALGLKPRTLNRLLKVSGTGLNQMLEDWRYETAQRMLKDPAVTVASVAWSLGYADATTFSRAFRRWSGMTTSEWRKTIGIGAS